MRKERPWIKWAAIAVSAVLLVVLLIASARVRRERQENREEWQAVSDAYAEKMRPLWAEKRSIERELTNIDDEELEMQMEAISAVVLCTEPDARLMDDVYPEMEERGYAGLVAVSEDRFPGEPGCITVSDMRVLLRRGWEICISVDESSDVATLYSRVIEAGLPDPVAAYYPNGGYKYAEKEVLASVGIDKVIVYGEQKTKQTDIWYLTAYGSYEHDSKTVFMETVDSGMGVVMTVGYENEREQYEEKNFKAMLNTIEMFAEEGYVNIRNFSDAYTYYRDYNDKINSGSAFSNRRTELEERLEEIEAEITASAK